jgi:hypothetical protein
VHTRKQLIVFDWLYEEVIRTGIKPRFPMTLMVECGHNYHRNMLRFWLALDPLADLKPVHAGQHEIQKDNVEVLLQNAFKRVGAGGRNGDLESLSLELGFK